MLFDLSKQCIAMALHSQSIIHNFGVKAEKFNLQMHFCSFMGLI